MILPHLISKEFKQMMRNWLLPVIFIILPPAMLNVVPRIATQEVKNVNVTVVDNDHSTLSRLLIEKISASKYFQLIATAATYRRAEEYMNTGEADIILEIEPDFERHLISDHVADVQVSANATNGTKSGLGSAYIMQIIQDFATGLPPTTAANGSPLAQQPSLRFLYNQNLDYKVYMIPAIIAMLMTLLIGFLPAMNIVLEKEKGTIEQINVTPISRMEFILSKLVPYWVVGIFLLFLSMLMGRAIHGVWPAGSIASILALATIYLLLISSLALVVSNYSNTIQQAALVMFFFLVIFLLLSGLLTPVSSMPPWAQYITEINPLRFFIEPMRMLYIKGSSAAELAPYYLRLIALAIAAGCWAIWSYKKSS